MFQLTSTPGHNQQVTLIDQSDRFVFKPLLYELLSGAASEEEVAPPFSQLLGPYPVTFMQGRVAAVEPEHATQVGMWVGGWGGYGAGAAMPGADAACHCLGRCMLMLPTNVTHRRRTCPPAPPSQDGGSTGGGVVLLQDGASVPYDWLVVSLGAETSTFGVPGVKQNALPFATYQDAQRVSWGSGQAAAVDVCGMCVRCTISNAAQVG